MEIRENMRRQVRTDTANIDKKSDLDGVIRQLSDFYTEGKKLYEDGFISQEAKEEWLNKLNDWNGKVVSLIESKFGVSAKFKYENTLCGFLLPFKESYPRGYNGYLKNNLEHERDRGIFSSRLEALKEIISDAPFEWRNSQSHES